MNSPDSKKHNPAESIADFLEILDKGDKKVTTLFAALSPRAAEGIESSIIDDLQAREAANILIQNGLATETGGKIFLNYEALRSFTHEN
ncbi:MAG: hypothetical protein Q8P30_02330 [Candidatus Uhrbacteria bacterium]|nr:hypothetical protein [Candidatus Uhrbacteria bacterium]